MTWTAFGYRSTYVVYIDGKAKKRTTSRIGAVRAACRFIRINAKGERMQLVKERPVQSRLDKVIYTWVKRGGVWRVEFSFAFGPSAEYTEEEESAA